MIFDDLLDARQSKSLILETDLHLLYLITPHFKNLKEPNWDAFLKLHKKLDKGELKVAEIYGIERDYMEWARNIRPELPGFIAEKIDGSAAAPDAEKEADFAMCLAEKMTEADFKLVRYSRFYMALMANEILKETPIIEICAMFGNCNRGVVQTCQ